MQRRITALAGQRCMRRADNGVGKATVYAKADNGVGKATVYAKADNGVGRATAPPSRHPRSTLRPQTSSFPKYPPHPNFVILRAVAESISPCQRTTQKIQRPLHATMDTATSRSMTALVSRRCMRRRITTLAGQRCMRRRITVLVSRRRMRRADNGVGKATVYAKTDNGVGRATVYAKGG